MEPPASPLVTKEKPPLWGWWIAGIAVALGTVVRIFVPFSDPDLNWKHPEGMLRTDPGLIYYITERIVEGGGLPPRDFWADTRVEFPKASNLPAMFTVGQEFLVAWSFLLFGNGMALHAFSIVVMAFLASLAALGVYGTVVELTGKVSCAGGAVALFVLSPANYRTLGFILMREDLSLPLFAIHCWLLARAARVRTPGSFALAGAALAAALSTWHAMGFVAAVEGACALAWLLRTGKSPFALPGSLALAAILVLAGVAVPVLQAKFFLFSLPMQIAAALVVAGLLERRGRSSPLSRAGLSLATLLLAQALSLAAVWCATGGTGDYGHVFELMWNKVRTFGALPQDPNAIPFGARLLWQGAFATGSIRLTLEMLPLCTVALAAALIAAAPAWIRGRGDAPFAVAALFGLLTWILAFLICRVLAVAGLALPVVTGLLINRLYRWRPGLQIAVLVLAQALSFGHFLHTFEDHWYLPNVRAEIAEVIGWMQDHLDDRGAVAGDFVLSTAVLAHTNHPIMLQPKYETRESRDRIEEFITAFYHASPADFRKLLTRKYGCRYLLVDRNTLAQWRYKAGLPGGPRQPPPRGSAAELLLSEYAEIPGYTLLYRSLLPTGWIRLYRLQ